MIDRLWISNRYMRGRGLEIGAFHNPFPVINGDTTVTYLDKYTRNQLIETYPEIRNHKAIPETDIVGDGETLESIQVLECFDFLISSHQLEHCEVPLAAIEAHLKVVKKGGHLFYAIPDKRFTFDKDRPITTLEHLIYEQELFKTGQQDDLDEDLLEHYLEYLLNVDHIESLEQRVEIAVDRIRKGMDIHYHCWDSNSFLQMFTYMAESRFDIELFSRAGHENFVVLKKL